MVINRTESNVILERLELTQSESTGAMTETWIPSTAISIAIKKIKAMQVVQGVREDIVYYTGITRYKGIQEAIHRLNYNGTIYTISDVKSSNLYSVLDLATRELF